MQNVYYTNSGCADCQKVDRWLFEFAAMMPELKPAIESFERVEVQADDASARPLPAFFVDGELAHEGPVSKRRLLAIVQEVWQCLM